MRARGTVQTLWRRHKYGAVATTVDGIRFASRKEARRFAELKLLEAAGEIRGLIVQPRYRLFVAPMLGRDPVHVADYFGDFQYEEIATQRTVIEDVKSPPTRTPVYRLKRKMAEAQYAITITEV